MAVNKSTEFKGQAAEEILVDIFLKGDTLSKNLINSIENVGSDSLYIQKSNTEDNLVDYICGFESQNDVNLTEVRADLKKISYMTEFCKEELKRWSSAKMNGRVGEAPQDEVDAILLDMNNKLSIKFERLLWSGNKTNTGEFDGFLTGLTADDTVAMATPEDVVDALTLAIDSTKEEILQSEDFVILVSTDIERKYNRSLLTRGFQQENSYFDGKKMETANGLPKGTILTYNKKNLNVISDLTSSITNITITDMAIINEHNMRLRSDFKVTTAIVDKTDVVYIKSL